MAVVAMVEVAMAEDVVMVMMIMVIIAPAMVMMTVSLSPRRTMRNIVTADPEAEWKKMTRRIAETAGEAEVDAMDVVDSKMMRKMTTTVAADMVDLKTMKRRRLQSL